MKLSRPIVFRRTKRDRALNRAHARDRSRAMITPEGIALTLTVASRGSRAGALLLDLAIIFAAIIATSLMLLWMMHGMVFDQRLSPAARQAVQFLSIIWLAAMFLLRNAYFLWFELGPRGATPGKRMVGIRIAARDGGRLSAEMVIARNLLRDIELFVPAVLLASIGGGNSGSDGGPIGIAAALWFLIFALMPLFNRDRLRAGDIIAGSWVVEAPRHRLEPTVSARMMPERAALAEAGSTHGIASTAFTDAELAIYGEYELQTLERILRANQAAPLATVQETIAGKIGRMPLPVDEPEAIRAFLHAYYAQLRARLEGGMRMGRRKADKFG